MFEGHPNIRLEPHYYPFYWLCWTFESHMKDSW
jgi:hypothetical protein